MDGLIDVTHAKGFRPAKDMPEHHRRNLDRYRELLHSDDHRAQLFRRDNPGLAARLARYLEMHP